MKLLRDIPTRHFVAIDIETVRIVEKYEDLSDEWKSAWEYKNKQSGEVPFFEELSDSWEKTASLYASTVLIENVSLEPICNGPCPTCAGKDVLEYKSPGFVADCEKKFPTHHLIGVLWLKYKAGC